MVRPGDGWALACLLLAAMTLGSCSDQTPSGLPRGKMVLETYPPPVDPAVAAQRRCGPLPDPVIIENGPKSTVIYTCRYARCETLKESIENFASPEGTIQASAALNVLLISDARDNVPALLKMVEELDHPVPQLLVEARVVEIKIDSDFEYEMKDVLTQKGVKDFFQTSGITLSTPGANPNTGMGGTINIRPLATNNENLDLFLRLMITKGYARLLSSPNLIVGAGTEASIITGEEVPIQSATVVSGSVSTTTSFKRVGIKLRVTPLQIAGDTAQVDIAPEVSAVTGYTNPGTSGVSNPIVSLRNVHSVLAMKDGEILTIGGLLSSEDRKVTRKVPGLGDIPGLGLLFQAQRNQTVQTQLVFFLRVNILPESRADTITYHHPGGGMEGVEDLPGDDANSPTTMPTTCPVEAPPVPRPVRRIVLTPSPASQPAGPTPASAPAPKVTRPAPRPMMDDSEEPRIIDR